MNLRRKGGAWMVPSQTTVGVAYTVNLTGEAPSCSCPDHEAGYRCKHIFAVEFTMRRETRPDGSTTVTRTMRVTYTQDWTAYNAAQTREKDRVAELLRGLCDGIAQPPQKMGRPRLPLSDLAFAAIMKVFTTVSGRRATCDIRECAVRGHVSSAPHYNSIFKALENPMLTPILKALVEESASPLKAIETDFAVDSSGFSSSVFDRWYEEKYGHVKGARQWVKAHLMTGVKTNIVTSVEVTVPQSHDGKYLVPLLNATVKRFPVAEVSADKEYLSSANLEAVVNAGAVPYIPFRSNITGKGSELWQRMFHFYHFKREVFLASYHKRSNVESTFSMIKRKFGSSVRSRTPVAQENEVLCKVICHNLCVLVQSIYELGIEPTFWAESSVAHKVGPEL
jgi:transposase